MSFYFRYVYPSQVLLCPKIDKNWIPIIVCFPKENSFIWNFQRYWLIQHVMVFQLKCNNAQLVLLKCFILMNRHSHIKWALNTALSIYNKNYNQRMSYLSTSHYKCCLIFKAFIDFILKVCSLHFLLWIILPFNRVLFVYLFVLLLPKHVL